jgi:hypothetical protein
MTPHCARTLHWILALASCISSGCAGCGHTTDTDDAGDSDVYEDADIRDDADDRVDADVPGDGEAEDDGDTGSDAAPTTLAPLGFSGAVSLDTRDAGAVETFLASMGYADPDEFQGDVARRMRDLGARSARIEFFYIGRGEIAETYAFPEDIHGEDFVPVGWLNPIEPAEGLDTEFEAAFEDLIERYPGIHIWQLGNEPDLLWRRPELYPDFFIRAQAVVRQTCPECLVLLAGISNQWDTSETSFELYDGYLTDITTELPDRPFDVFDFHFYKERLVREEVLSAIEDYSGLLRTHGLSGVPLWCTETGVYSGFWGQPGYPLHTAEDQARQIVQLHSLLLSHGVERVFYWTVVEIDGGGGPWFEHMGLVFNGLHDEEMLGIAGGIEKPAYQSYQLMARGLVELAAAEEIEDGVVRFVRADGSLRFAVWADTTVSRTISGLPWESARVTNMIPDEGGVLTVEELAVSGGELTVEASIDPIWIEPGES